VTGLGHKKTGPNSQGVTERPGEFSNWYFSRYPEISDVRLYPTHNGKPKNLSKEQLQVVSNQSCLRETVNHVEPSVSNIRTKYKR
jgi:hypothetical protein